VMIHLQRHRDRMSNGREHPAHRMQALTPRRTLNQIAQTFGAIAVRLLNKFQIAQVIRVELYADRDHKSISSWCATCWAVGGSSSTPRASSQIGLCSEVSAISWA